MPEKTGGKQTYVQTLSQELLKNGHQVAICTLGETHRNPSQKDEVPLYRIGGFFQKMPFLFRYQRLKSHPPVRDRFISTSLKKIVEEEKSDIIHCHDWMLYSSLPLATRIGLPVILTLHDYGFICVKSILTKDGRMCKTPLTINCIRCGKEVYGSAKSMSIYCALKLGKLQLRDVTKYIAISDFQKDVYRRVLNLPPRGIVVIPNSIDVKFFTPQEQTQENSMKENRRINCKKIAVVGRLSWDRMNQISSVVAAVPLIEKEYPKTHVSMVGWSEGGASLNRVNEIVRRTTERMSQAKIQIISAPSQHDLLEIYGSADVVIGVGRVALEAMSCAKPVVIAGDTVGPFGGNFGGIVTPHNVKGLRSHNFTGRNSNERTTAAKVAEACIRLLCDQQSSKRLGDFGRKYVEREHDIEKKVKDIVRLYEELLN